MVMNNRQALENNPSKRSRNEPPVFVCEFCGQSFLDWKEFLDHMITETHKAGNPSKRKQYDRFD